MYSKVRVVLNSIGIFSPYNTKWKEFIIHELDRRGGEEGADAKSIMLMKEKFDKVLRRMDTLQRQEENRRRVF